MTNDHGLSAVEKVFDQSSGTHKSVDVGARIKAIACRGCDEPNSLSQDEIAAVCYAFEVHYALEAERRQASAI